MGRHHTDFVTTIFMPPKTPRLSTELLAYYRLISSRPFTVVDVETTGFTPAECRVIEISVIQASLKDGIILQKTSLINPGILIPPQITRFTGITQAMVDGAPPPHQVWHDLQTLLVNGILTAHNLGFDYPFLQSELAHVGVSFKRAPTQQLCTVLLSRQLLPHLASRSLPNLVKHFGFPVEESHRAAADAIACWLLTEKLLTYIQTQSDEVLLEQFAQQWLNLRDVAAIFGCSQTHAQRKLHQAGVVPRIVGTRQTPMYQRMVVEQLKKGNE
jgi:DNA polymerase III subunit epsilon